MSGNDEPQPQPPSELMCQAAYRTFSGTNTLNRTPGGAQGARPREIVRARGTDVTLFAAQLPCPLLSPKTGDRIGREDGR